MRELVLFAMVWTACGGSSTSPGARPHDMSASAHDREAAAHDAAATEHGSRYEPGIADPCDPRMATCWNAARTSTYQHGQEAEHHAQVAAEHRRASAAVRAAEQAACGGVPATDRDTSPFERIADIATVAPLAEQPTSARERDATATRSGIVVTFQRVPGLTADRLQRMVDCHLARNAALGHAVPEMNDCPLVPRGVAARVRQGGDSLAVEIRASDAATAQEIQRRGERLLARKQALPR